MCLLKECRARKNISSSSPKSLTGPDGQQTEQTKLISLRVAYLPLWVVRFILLIFLAKNITEIGDFTVEYNMFSRARVYLY